VRLVTVELAGAVEPAALDAAGGLRSLRALGHPSVRALVEAGPAAWDAARGAAADGALPSLGPWSAATATRPPLPDPPRNAFCVGTNYRAHIDELDRPGGAEVAAIVSFLSRGMRLLPGDIIFTGTAAGVGAGQDPPVSLHDGDVVEITSPELGTLRNRFADRP
jgi:2-keto-4-pentenoate hydratase/2-oxohepta-3-ene-1,7-dioic acid hydratase in catechol pathway